MTSVPVLARTREELSALLDPARRAGRPVGLVPTMGALHRGHATLMDVARQQVDGPLVVSVFVNPMQFAQGEDLDRYPRSLTDDVELCAAHDVDVVFAPDVAEVYPHGVPDGLDESVTIDPGPLADILEGTTRPGHFGGVLTVVAKLFGLVRPDVAAFGEKDYQQLVLVRRMVADLCQDVDVIGVPTVREDDGLALSSRNRYLDDEQRRRATALSRTLRAAAHAAAYGIDAAIGAARAELRSAHGVDLDYLEITDPELGPPLAEGPARILIAARLGSTRLIDNLPLMLGTPYEHRPTPEGVS